jgi:hypothetical protein
MSVTLLRLSFVNNLLSLDFSIFTVNLFDITFITELFILLTLNFLTFLIIQYFNKLYHVGHKIINIKTSEFHQLLLEINGRRRRRKTDVLS